MTNQPVLVANSLEQIYTKASVNSQTRRWASLLQTFADTFALQPSFVARAPGRVNIIGEHIDYCGFSVLPSAIEPDLLIAGSVVSAHQSSNQIIHVQAVNLNPAYPEASFDCDPSTQLPIDNGGWSAYLKSAFNVCLDHVKSHSSSGQLKEVPSSVKFLIDGSVPAGSGLSSSAAIATAAVLAALHILQPDKQLIHKSLVASLAIKAEQACGVSVGGMDQTASVFGQPAKLLHIEFTPTTKVVPLELPNQPSTAFIIANSLVTSNKADSAKEQYNLRVVECRIATRILSNELLKNRSSDPYPKHLRELVERYSSPDPSSGSRSICSAIQLVLDKMEGLEDLLGGIDGFNQQSVLDVLQITQVQFKDEILVGMVVEPKNGLFKPYCRARHVLTEAQRVYKFRELLEKATGMKDSEEVILSIGQLMNESQASCEADYECSCEALDELISIARSNGSLGSRLTGAGWGGSSVHLVRDSEIEPVIKALETEYYHSSPRFPTRLTDQEFTDACFATQPQGGACLFSDLQAILP